MRSLLLHRYGDRLQYDQSSASVEQPQLDQNDINSLVVKVEYAGVNPVDYKVRKGNLKSLLTLPFPLVLGLDYSGTLISKHDQSTCPIAVGTKVFGKLKSIPRSGSGTYGEYVQLRWQHDLISAVPDGVSMEQAAGVGVAALTAAVGLIDYLHVPVPEETSVAASSTAKQKILIIGASGGVGHFAVQMARRCLQNVHTIAVCSGRNAEYVGQQQLGADQIIDYTRGPVSQQLTELGFSTGSLDGIFDLVGGDEYYWELRHFIRRGGHFVTAAGPIAGGDVQLTLQSLAGMVWRLSSRRLASWFGLTVPYSFISDLPSTRWPLVVNWLSTGQLKTTVSAVVPAERGYEAHDLIETGRTVGKIVIKF